MAGTFTNLLYHLVFSTKDRIPLIDQRLQHNLYEYIGGIIRGEGGVLLEIGGMPDHVHLLTKFKPVKSVSEMLNRIKAKSSKWANETKLIEQDFAWQGGYAAFSVSESQVATIRLYLQNQEEHHRRQSYQDEVRALLDKHGIEYDERYLWS
jgi:REP element-mobilizing transposase RayT